MWFFCRFETVLRFTLEFLSKRGPGPIFYHQALNSTSKQVQDVRLSRVVCRLHVWSALHASSRLRELVVCAASLNAVFSPSFLSCRLCGSATDG